jgi:hypothetical protein
MAAWIICKYGEIFAKPQGIARNENHSVEVDNSIRNTFMTFFEA